jgi:outer membrane receptor protein involved in Fe transport
MATIGCQCGQHNVRTLLRIATASTAVAIVVLLITCAASAQTTGSIVGKATDPSGAVVPGVLIKATNDATSFSRQATTGVSGEYVISLLPVGHYTITAQKEGFDPYRLADVVVNVNENIRVDVPFGLKKVTESVAVVSSSVAEVETRSATLGKVIDETKIVDLPLNGRNFLNLAVLQPGVVPAMSLGSNNTPEFPGGERSDFQVNGLRLQSNNFLLDGADNNEPFLGTAMATPSPDALEEFKILTNNYGAEFGGGGGSIVNIITKGGTNQFHGSLYEFFRNDVLDAENFFAVKKDKLRRNQFGGTFGGPIIKDKTFFFFNYEGFRLRQGQTQIATVPSDLQRAGIFTSGTVTSIDPTAAALLPLIPRANVGTNEFVSSPVQVQDTDQYNTRIDHKISDKNYLSARYFLINGTNDRNFTNTLFGVPINLPNFPLQDNYRIQNLAVSDTHFFTTNFSNEFRFGFNRGRFDSAISTIVRDPASLGFNLPSTKAVHNMPLIALAGYTAFGTFNDSPSYRRENTYQIQDNLTWVHGRHSLRYGVQVLKNQMDIPSSDSIGEGAFLFLPKPETATTNYVPIQDAFANFLQGQFDLFTQAGGVTTRSWRFSSYSFYFQDELRVTPTFTLTLGLRYELPIPPTDSKNRVVAYRPGAQSTVHTNAPPGLLFVGDPGITRSTIQTDKNNFAPRVGFAWDPKGNGRMSLRGGYGIFYDRLIGLLPFQFGLDPPFDIIPSIPNFVENHVIPGSSFGDPFSGGSPFAGKTAQQVADSNIFPLFSFLQVMDPRMRTPYVQQWNLTYQYQATKDMVLEAGYVGTKGTKLVQPVDLNTQVGTGRPLVPNFFQLSNYQTTDNSSYQGLQISANKRMGHGLSFLGSYTWSHSIDGSSIPVNFLNPNSEAIFPEDKNNLRLDRGNSAFDVRHRFVLSALYELPSFKSGSGFARQALGNWQVNGILTWQTGFPFTVLDTSDPNLDGQPTDRPNQVGNPFGPGTRNPQKWFDASAFVHPPQGTDGLVARNSLEGPGISNLDFSLFKNFRIGERQNVQFRAEFFNIFNHPNFDIPVNDFNSPAVGQIHDTRLPNRQLQFALKYAF